jgi:hypothetical protein
MMSQPWHSAEPAPQPGGKKPEALLPPAGVKQMGREGVEWPRIRHSPLAILYSHRQRFGWAKNRIVEDPFRKRGSENR